MNDLFSEPGFQHRDIKVEAFLLNEGWKIEFVELDDTILASIDISKFQTRDVQGRNNFVDHDRVAVMAESLEIGQPLPGVVLFLTNGKYIMCDGRHRIETYRTTKSKTFWAYVILENDESKVASNAIRLSNLLNEMNGERAGQTIEDKNERQVQAELCAQDVFAQACSGIPREKALNYAFEKHKIKTGTKTANMVRNKVCHKFVSVYMAEAAPNAIEAEKMLKKLSMSFIDHIEYIFCKAENPDRIKLTNTVLAAQKKRGCNQVRDILCTNKDLRVSEIIKILRESACLTDDDREVNPEEEARVLRFNKINNAIRSFHDELNKDLRFYGEDRQRLVDRLAKTIPVAQTALRKLQSETV